MSAPDAAIEAGSTEYSEGSANTQQEYGETALLAQALSKDEEEAIRKKLPELESLLPLVSPELITALDDLLRVRWSKVIRVKKRQITNP